MSEGKIAGTDIWVSYLPQSEHKHCNYCGSGKPELARLARYVFTTKTPDTGKEYIWYVCNRHHAYYLYWERAVKTTNRTQEDKIMTFEKNIKQVISEHSLILTCVTCNKPLDFSYSAETGDIFIGTGAPIHMKDGSVRHECETCFANMVQRDVDDYMWLQAEKD